MKKKTRTNKKSKIIILIAIVLLIAVVTTIIVRNMIISKQIEKNEYLAIGNENSSLLAGYIRKGVTIGGVTGTLESLDTSDATAIPEDILWGKTAYVKGEKITGTKILTIQQAKESRKVFENTETLIDDDGNNVTIPKGFSVHEESNTKVDEGIIITDGTNEFVWVPVKNPSAMFIEETVKLNLVDTTTSIYSNLREIFIEDTEFGAGKPGNTQSLREPDMCDYDMDAQYYKTILGFNSAKEMADSMVAEYKAMSDSIKKYYGFYVGRYELTGTVENPTEKAGKVLTAENGNWYTLYKACQNVIKNNSDVKSTMIYGCQWDEIMIWLKNTKFKGQEDKVNLDSSSWGNYGTGIAIDTGSNANYKANEIFDLAGNHYDWTQTVHSIDNRVGRGGYYKVSGATDSAVYSRGYGPYSGGSDASSRAILYIV